VSEGEITLEEKAGTFSVDRFFISKYPVTWIQYRSFLEAKDGFQNKKWWEGLAEPQDEPGEQYRKLSNHPAENVSWYDAVAFCRWLTERLGYEIRLPTEWEWQQAATGGNPANQWPWGKEWDSSRANTIESRLSRTTAVGLYPRGMSPAEALDMSGNVREWCLNEHENLKRINVTGKATRVLRGGSWFDLQYFARCDARYNFSPYGRYYSNGFRCSEFVPHLVSRRSLNAASAAKRGAKRLAAIFFGFDNDDDLYFIHLSRLSRTSTYRF
jgi:formylglycine-generating enzyme required for sulfatase activity